MIKLGGNAMSEAEFIEITIAIQAEGGRAFMDFVTVLFGYLAATHFLGPRLSLSFAVLISALYSAFIVFPAVAVTRVLNRAFEMGRDYPEFGLDSAIYGPHALHLWIYIPAIVIFLGWAISIGYMAHVRRKSANLI
jgi:hypothetical protein